MRTMLDVLKNFIPKWEHEEQGMMGNFAYQGLVCHHFPHGVCQPETQSSHIRAMTLLKYIRITTS